MWTIRLQGTPGSCRPWRNVAAAWLGHRGDLS
jgi:hypothetical protein